MSNEFEPDTFEKLISAFRVMDPERTGKIKIEIIKELLTTLPKPVLADFEVNAFILYAQDKTGQYIEYEEYVAKLCEENEKH